MIKVFINDVNFTDRVEIDLSFVEKLNRELDEGYISIPHTFKATPFTLFDIVDIYWDDELIFSGRVSMDRVSVASYNDRLFNHEISIIEHTKILEKYIVKGKTFTKSITQTSSNPYTLFDVLTILKNTVPLELKEISGTLRPFGIPPETETLTSSIIAPEFNFKDLTLRQALDQVASVLDSIVRLDRNSSLIFTQYDKLKDKIDFVANDYMISQNINDYSTTIESEMLNSVMGANDIVNEQLEEVYPSKTGFATLRSGSFQFTFENEAYIETKRPIYRVNDVITLVDVTVNKKLPGESQENLINQILEISIGDRILPFEVWNTLEVDGGLEGNDPTPIEFKPDNFFKNNTFYYKYGKKNIFVGEITGVFGTVNTIEPLVYASTFARLREQGVLPSNMDTSPFIDENGVEWELLNAIIPTAITNVESQGRFLTRTFYTPIPRALRFQVERDTVSEVHYYTETIVNQQTRLVDINKYGNNLKGRVNQMGNSIKQLSHRISSPLDSFSVGDFVLDDGLYVITQKEVIVHRNYSVVNYELTRNFNNFSQFMGVDKEIRQSEVGESDRTVERDLLYKEYVEIETTKNTAKQGSKNSLTLLDNVSFIKTLDKNEQHVGVDFAAFTNENFNNWFVVGLNKVSGGNTISFNFELEDNVSAGTESRLESRTLLPNRSFNEPVPYTDEKGRFSNLKLRIYKDALYPITVSNSSEFDDAVDFSNQLPFLSNSDLPNAQPVIEGEWLVSKDNREVIKFSLLYSILSKNIEDVVVGNKLSTLNGLIKEGSNNVQLWVYENRNFDISDSNKSLETPDIVYNSNLQLNINTAQNKIIIENEIPEGYSWALVNDEGFPYLMNNNDNNIILFNFENKRTGIKYFSLKSVDLELSVSSKASSTLNILDGQIEFIDLSSKSISKSETLFLITFDEPVSATSKTISKSLITFTVDLPPSEVLTLTAKAKSSASTSFTTDITDPVQTETFSLTVKSVSSVNTSFTTDIIPPSDDLELTSTSIATSSIEFTENINPFIFTVRARINSSETNLTANSQWQLSKTGYNQSGQTTLTTTFANLRTDVPIGTDGIIQVTNSVVFGNTTYLFVRWIVNGVNQPLGDETVELEVNSTTSLEAGYEAFGGF